MGDIKRIVVTIDQHKGTLANDIASSERKLTFVGRSAWVLDNLIRSGARGVTPLENPAPRWSEYVRRLRSKGVVIETIEEKHGGTYGGRHGRYVLRSPVRVVEEIRA